MLKLGIAVLGILVVGTVVLLKRPKVTEAFVKTLDFDPNEIPTGEIPKAW
jgi:hypothetical protein